MKGMFRTFIISIFLSLGSCGQDSSQPSTDVPKVDGAAQANPDQRQADALPDGNLNEKNSAVPMPEQIGTLIRMEDARRLPRAVVERMLKSPDVVIRRRTLLALGRIGNDEALGPLRSTLTESDTKTREQALMSLGQLRSSAHKDAERVLKSFLDLAPRPQEKRAAIESLGRVGSSKSVGILLESLESPDPAIRSASARALGRLALRKQGPGEQAIVALASHLSDSDPDVRLSAAFALSRCRELTESALPILGPPLEKALRKSKNAEVRIMAARAMGALDVGGAGYLLAAIEHDNDWRVRTAAATSVGRRATSRQRSRGLKLIWNYLAEDPPRMNTPDLHALMALLDETIARPAKSLGKTLKMIEDGAGEILTKTTDQKLRLTLAHVRCRTALSIDRAMERPSRVRNCDSTDPPLLTESEHKQLEARAWVGSTRPQSLKRLRGLMKNGDPAVRLVAIEALSSRITAPRLTLLERALRDKNAFVVAAAAHNISLAKDFYNPTVIEKAQQLTITEHTGDGAVTHSLSTQEVKGRQLPTKALIKALKNADADRDTESAINLLNAIGALEATKAADAALPFSHHHNQTVRRAARRALEKLGRDPGAEISPDPPNLADPSELAQIIARPPTVTVETTKGPFVLEMRPDLAPTTVANFLELAEKGFYNGVRFHRVVPGFVAQTGDPTATGYGGPGYTIRCENSDARYKRGAVGMALAGPDTGGSQFFIVYSEQPHLERRYTIFAYVKEGQGIVDSLQQWDKILSTHKTR